MPPRPWPALVEPMLANGSHTASACWRGSMPKGWPHSTRRSVTRSSRWSTLVASPCWTMKELRRQLVSLERRTGSTGRDSINHRPGAHDDVANAACGALLLALRGSPVRPIGGTPSARRGIVPADRRLGELATGAGRAGAGPQGPVLALPLRGLGHSLPARLDVKFTNVLWPNESFTTRGIITGRLAEGWPDPRRGHGLPREG